MMRAVMLLLVGCFAVATAFSLYLWRELDAERAGSDNDDSIQVSSDGDTTELDELRNELSDTEVLLVAADKKLATTEEENVTLRTKSEKAEDEVDELQEQVDDLRSQLEATKGQLTALTADSDTFVSSIRASFELLDACTAATDQVLAAANKPGNNRSETMELAGRAVGACQAASEAVEAAPAP
jgi:chromosome segregation ATPase